MEVSLNRHWNRIYINCNGKAIKIMSIQYPVYADYLVEEVAEVEECTETEILVKDTQLFSGTNGEYIYLDYENNTLELWGTDGKRDGLRCYAEFKNGMWHIS